MIGLFAEHGPCSVNVDSNSTTLNPWSWTETCTSILLPTELLIISLLANMLYIEQPVQVGFSYDTPTNFSTNLYTGSTTKLNSTSTIPKQNNTLLVGTTSDMVVNNTANSTTNAARALWHFAQTWFQEFPQHKPVNDKVAIATESRCHGLPRQKSKS